MPPLDPFAPATSPRHPRNASKAAREEVELLAATHATDAERERYLVPSLAELRARRTLLIRNLEARDSSAEAPPPVEIIDGTGQLVRLTVSDDGTEASWEPVPEELTATPEPEVDPESGTAPEPQADDLDRLDINDLRGIAKTLDLSGGGSKDDLRARIREHRAAK